MYVAAAPLVYTLLFLIWLQRKGYFGGLHARWWQGAFILHVLAGIGNLAVWVFAVGHGDSINYIHDGHMIWETLRSHPSHFLELTFGWGADNVYPEHLLYISEPLKYSWNNIEYTMVRIHAILFVFTFGNAWGNIVLLNIAYFAGARFLYFRLWQRHPERKTGLFGLVLLIPSVVIWSAGTLKEGPALMLMMFISGLLLDMENQFRWRSLIWLFVCMAAMLLIREYYVIFLVPLLFLWWMGQKISRSGWLFFGAALAGMVVVLVADRTSDEHSVAEIICEAQQYYIPIGTDPDYDYHIYSGIDDREPLTELPGVLNNIFFRPNVIQSTSLVRRYFALELILCWIVLLMLMIQSASRRYHISPTTWLLTWLSVAVLLLYGYVVTDADTMSRYRSIPVFLLLVAWVLPGERKLEG